MKTRFFKAVFLSVFTAMFLMLGFSAKAQKVQHLTKETFKQKIWDYESNPQSFVYKGDKPAIVDFYADWCRPCKIIAPILDEIQEENKGKLQVYKVDTEAQKELAAFFQIQSIPAVLFIPVGDQPQMALGARSKEEFQSIVKQVLKVE